MTSILQSIGAGIVSAALFIGGIFGYSPEPSYAPEPEALGADTVLPIAGQTYTLAGTGISSTATSFTLTSFTLTQTGYEIQDSDMSSTFYVTFEPGSRSRQELVSCTTVTQNSNDTATISGCTRGLLPITPYTASTTYQFAHAGGTSVVFSNPPQLYNEAAMKNNDETITGQWTFDVFPITASTSLASATTSGIAELATGAEAASSTDEGDIGGGNKLVLHTGISTSSAPSSGNVVVVTGDDGNIDGGFISTLGEVNFTATTTGTLGSTTIRVYTASTTYTKPQYLKHIIVEVQGAGGDGSSDASNGDAGGGGGGYAKSILSASQLSATTSIVIGAAGLGSGNTSFGTITAGNGSDGSGTSGGSGGTASGGNILNINGENAASITSSYQGSAGGDSFLGKGGSGGLAGNSGTDIGAAAQSGIGYGAGGGGAGSANDGSPQGGSGTGTTGVVIITEYF